MDTITAQVQMLGGFRMTINGITISDQSNQSKKPWSILEYLITFRNREISSNELIDLIWSESQSVNPSGALKTLVFRTRKLLEPFGIPTHHLIVQKHGAYAWNPQIEISLDTDHFEALLKKSDKPGISADEQLKLYLEALALYNGDFLPKSNWESWVIPITTYYHSQFLHIAHKAIEMLSDRGDWDRIVHLCQRAIQVEPFDDDFHYHLILALFNKGEQVQALDHYQQTTNLFYNEFAITPSERLKTLYKLIRDKEHGITTDLSVIQEAMQEENHSTGAFYCEYSVFRDLYQLERRSIGRTGDSMFLCLLTICDEDGTLPKSFITARAMTNLGAAIASSLRQGDVYTRYSVSQYMIMLPTASYENGEMVLQRIIRNFRKLYIRKELIVNYSLQAILPDTVS